MAEEAFYQGSINEAINKSQIERKLFVVSLQDDSNASKQLDSVTWTDAQVKTVLRNECIAIRLVKGTQQAEQFIQIYNPTQCPCIYFLAQGFPFLIIPGFVSAAEFIQKYQGVKLAYSSALTSSLTSSNIGNPNPTSTSSTPVTTSSTNNSNNNYSAPRPSNEPKTTVNPSNNSSSTKPVVSATNNNNSAADADLDDEEEARQLIMKQYKKSGKSADGTNDESRPLTQEEIDEQVKKYEEKLKEIRARKAKEKEEEERNKELERIKSAKEMQAARAKIEEIKRQKEIEKRKKEQEEEKAYKEKLRLQIQKDKEERERKAKQGLAESTDTSTNKTAYINASANNTNLTSSTSIKSYDKTTLRFRLLNGETLVQEFPGDETLEGVVGFLNNAYNYRVKYSLKTVYPNHLFLPHEYSKTLKQLNLVPNATLILTEAPLNGSGPSGLSSSESSGSSWSPFSLIGSMWKWAWGSGDSSNTSTGTDTNYSGNTNTSSNQNAAQGQRNDRVRHRGAGPNVVSLGDMRRDGQGDDRHKSTWNGNSTQQQ